MKIPWTPIVYRDFYDYPHAILTLYRGQLWFLDNRFDEDIDDYPSEFHVYRLPEKFATLLEPVDPGQPGPSWLMLPGAGHLLGTFAVTDLRLDETRRRFLDARVLDRLVS